MPLLILLLMGGCGFIPSKSNSFNTNSLIGEWQCTLENYGECDLVFQKDGKFHGKILLLDRRLIQFSGKWSLENKKIRYIYQKYSSPDFTPGTTDEDTLLNLTPFSFTVETKSGAQRTYNKYTEQEASRNPDKPGS